MKTTQISRLRIGAALRALTLCTTSISAGAIYALPAAAQDFTTGALVGSVETADGARAAEGSISLVSNAQGFSRTANLNSEGSFRIQSLPVGNYTVTVTVPGFEPVTSDVSITAGRNSTYTFTVGAGTGEGGEIVVTGARQGNDFGNNTGGLSIGNVSELLNTTPIARNQTALILLSPGTQSGDTTFGNLASIGGATVAENSYYVNGLNVTNFRTFVGSNNPPIEFYQSLDVKLYGLPAEFGRALGGFTTAVTKSGSNEFKAGMLAAFAPDALRSTAPNTYAARNEDDYNQDLEVNFYASGPIIKDRLFFYGLYNPNYSKIADTSITAGQRLTQTDKSPFFGGKLDLIIADGHRLEGTYFRNASERRTRYTAVDAAGVEGAVLGDIVSKSGGDNFVGTYTGQFTNWLTLSAAYGEAHDNQSAAPNPIRSLVQSSLTGTTTTAAGFSSALSTDDDTRKFYRADADIYANFLGSHHFRVGYEREELSSSTDTRYAGGYRYLLAPTYVYRYYYENVGTWDSRNESFYIQDSWSLANDRVNLQLGLRNDKFSNNALSGETYFESGDQWGPRLGASFDVFGDKRTTLRGSWSRYFMPVATNTNIRLGGAELYYRQRFAYPTGVNPASFSSTGLPAGLSLDGNGNILGLTTRTGGAVGPCPDVGPDAGALCSSVSSDGVLGPTDTLVSTSLQPSYTDEWSIGLQHRIGDWEFGLTYLNRRLGRTLDDVAIDAAVLAYCDREGIAGCGDSFTGFHQYVLANPGSDITVRLDGDCAVDARQCEVATLSAADLGYPKATRNYDSIQFQFSKGWSNNWAIGGSYAWTRLRGNYEGAVKSDNGQDDAGLTQDFDQPGLLDGAYGVLANGRSHTFKLYGTVGLTDEFRVGFNMLFESPRKFSCIGVHPTDVFAAQYQNASFFCTQPQFADRPEANGSYLVERGSAFNSEWRKQIDVNVQYDLPGLPGSFVSLDVFNVFNFKSKLDYNEFGDNADGSTNNQFGQVLGYQTPRYARFTLGLRFGETGR